MRLQTVLPVVLLVFAVSCASAVKTPIDFMTLNVAMDAEYVYKGLEKLERTLLEFVNKNPTAYHVLALQELLIGKAEYLVPKLSAATGRKWSLVHAVTSAIFTDGTFEDKASCSGAPITGVYQKGIGGALTEGARMIIGKVSYVSKHVGCVIQFGSVRTLVYNIHFTSHPYLPYEFCQGKDEASAREQDQSRLAYLQTIFNEERYINAYASDDTGIFFLGDFNARSHEDSAAPIDEKETAACKKRGPFEWPITKKLANEGFLDAYRTLIPATENAGATWSPIFTTRPKTPKTFYNNGIEPQDRIDMIWYSNPRDRFDIDEDEEVLEHCPNRQKAKLLPSVAGGKTSYYGDASRPPPWYFNEWLSDHKAVTALFEYCDGQE